MDKLNWIAGEKAETKQLKKCFDEITTKEELEKFEVALQDVDYFEKVNNYIRLHKI